MKKTLYLFLLLFSISFYAQNETKVTTKKCVPRKGFHLRLKAVINDSRCPEGVTCIWAGEVSATIEVYKDKKLVEEKDIIFNATNRVENIKWFENYLSKKIKGIGVMPYPKDGVTIEPKKQYIRIVFAD
jgi:hypothetical protein